MMVPHGWSFHNIEKGIMTERASSPWCRPTLSAPAGPVLQRLGPTWTSAKKGTYPYCELIAASECATIIADPGVISNQWELLGSGHATALRPCSCFKFKTTTPAGTHAVQLWAVSGLHRSGVVKRPTGPPSQSPHLREWAGRSLKTHSGSHEEEATGAAGVGGGHGGRGRGKPRRSRGSDEPRAAMETRMSRDRPRRRTTSGSRSSIKETNRQAIYTQRQGSYPAYARSTAGVAN
uniref:Uncharacterized protein n=1 Tax=Knipowitschia caucasica TaxID=637954 RepID=A0AAV2MI16_KNICA